MMYKEFLFSQPGPMMSNVFGGVFGILLFPLVIWTLVWKGMALWKAAQKEDKIWFVILLIVNTLGILDILYIYVFSKGVSKKSKRK